MPSDQTDGAVVRLGESIRKALGVKVKDRTSLETLGFGGLHLSCAESVHTLIQLTKVTRVKRGAVGRAVGECAPES